MQTPVSSVQSAIATRDLQERWWVGTPPRLRRVNILFSEVWRDGIYLTRWPITGLGLPLVVLLAGVFEGATHWTINQVPHAQNIAFTEFFPFLLFAAAIGALSANLGLMLTIGYALGDFVIAGPRLPLPQLISYIIISLVAFQPTIFVRYTVSSLRPAFQWAHGFGLVLAQALIAGLVQGGLVFLWTLSTPALIQIFWSWSKLSPSPAATYYLQNDGIWIAGIAACAAFVRALLAYWAARTTPALVQRAQRQEESIAEAQTRAIVQAASQPAWLRSIQSAVGVFLTAGFTTLLFSGFIATVQTGILVFGIVALMLFLRNIFLPLFSFWNAWARYLAEVPVILRLVYSGYLAYQLTQLAVSYVPVDAVTFTSNSARLLPVLIGACISLLMATLLLPRGRQKRQ